MAAFSSLRRRLLRILLLLFLGFAAGFLYNHRHCLAALLRACTRAAAQHVWDALCLALAMAAILTGLLAGKTGSNDPESLPRTFDFFDHFMQLEVLERDSCAHGEAHVDDNHNTTHPCADDPFSSIAFSDPQASIATTTIATSTHRAPSACNDKAFLASPSPVTCCSFHQASVACHYQPFIAAPHNGSCISKLFVTCSFCNNRTEAFMACSCNDDQTKPAGVHISAISKQKLHGDQCLKEDLPKLLLAHAAPGGVFVEDEGEVKLGCGLQKKELGYGGQDHVQEVKLGYGGAQEMQAQQGRCTPIAAASCDPLEDEEYRANIMECAEISRKADAFISSFRKQMRLQMLDDMLLCA